MPFRKQFAGVEPSGIAGHIRANSASFGARALRFRIRPGPISENTRLLLFCAVTSAACIGCGYESTQNLNYSPPRGRICGVWVIDRSRTHWNDAKPLLESESLGAQHGFLEIGHDGQFAIQDLPDFSREGFWPFVPRLSASGKWWTDFDPMNGWSYLWLNYEKVNGEPVEHRCAVAHFRRERELYSLHITIGDPDSRESLVLRKADAHVSGAKQTLSSGFGENAR